MNFYRHIYCSDQDLLKSALVKAFRTTEEPSERLEQLLSAIAEKESELRRRD